MPTQYRVTPRPPGHRGNLPTALRAPVRNLVRLANLTGNTPTPTDLIPCIACPSANRSRKVDALESQLQLHNRTTEPQFVPDAGRRPTELIAPKHLAPIQVVRLKRDILGHNTPQLADCVRVGRRKLNGRTPRTTMCKRYRCQDREGNIRRRWLNVVIQLCHIRPLSYI